MKDNITGKILWNRAGTAGAALGLVSSVYLFASHLFYGSEPSAATTAVTFVMWAVKFTACIWLMKFFMKRFAAAYDADKGAVFRFGMAAAACSALLYSAVSLADILFIHPDMIHEQFELTIREYGSMLDSNTMSVLGKVEDIMPQITFFSNLFYCFVYGTVLSLILSRSFPSADPFAEHDCEDDTQTDE